MSASKAKLADSNTYDIVFDGPISGLAKGADVRFNGIKVGDVRTLRIDERNAQHVVARVRVDGETPVRSSSEAKLEGVGLTGVTMIQLTAGDPYGRVARVLDEAPGRRVAARPGSNYQTRGMSR